MMLQQRSGTNLIHGLPDEHHTLAEPKAPGRLGPLGDIVQIEEITRQGTTIDALSGCWNECDPRPS